MKEKTITIFRFFAAFTMLCLITVTTTVAQSPGTFNYQAVLRDSDGNIRENASVAIELILHQGSATGTVVYSENHNVTTNAFGLVNLEVGSGNPADFSLIDWSAGPYFMEVKVDDATMGTSQLLSVPYALYAESGPPIELADNSVSSEHIVDGAITGADIGTDAVGADEISDGAVGTSEIAVGAVSSTRIAPDAVYESHIANGTIQDADISASANIAASKIDGLAGIEWMNISSTNIDLSSATNVGSVRMSIPVDGYVLLTFSGRCLPSTGDRIVLAASDRSEQWGANDGCTTVYGDGGHKSKNFSHSRVYAVDEGIKTFYAVAQNYVDYGGDGIASIYGILTAQFFPRRYISLIIIK